MLPQSLSAVSAFPSPSSHSPLLLGTSGTSHNAVVAEREPDPPGTSCPASGQEGAPAAASRKRNLAASSSPFERDGEATAATATTAAAEAKASKIRRASKEDKEEAAGALVLDPISSQPAASSATAAAAAAAAWSQYAAAAAAVSNSGSAQLQQLQYYQYYQQHPLQPSPMTSAQLLGSQHFGLGAGPFVGNLGAFPAQQQQQQQHQSQGASALLPCLYPYLKF